jgi:hypothetical protein
MAPPTANKRMAFFFFLLSAADGPLLLLFSDFTSTVGFELAELIFYK